MRHLTQLDIDLITLALRSSAARWDDRAFLMQRAFPHIAAAFQSQAKRASALAAEIDSANSVVLL